MSEVHANVPVPGQIANSTLTEPTPQPIIASPAQRLTMPEYLDWHMILDHELSQLSRPETGVIGSVGFVGLGGVIGLAASFFEALEKVNGSPPIPLSIGDIVSVCMFVGSTVIAGLCLLIFGLAVFRNRGLARTIRSRQKQPFGSQGQD